MCDSQIHAITSSTPVKDTARPDPDSARGGPKKIVKSLKGLVSRHKFIEWDSGYIAGIAMRDMATAVRVAGHWTVYVVIAQQDRRKSWNGRNVTDLHMISHVRHGRDRGRGSMLQAISGYARAES